MLKNEEKLVSEFKQATRELKNIHNELIVLHQPLWKWSLKEFGIGIIRGVGFTIGTTIIATIVLYLIQRFVDLTSLTNIL